MDAVDRTPVTSRERIVLAAAELLHGSGPAAVTTRGVADAAGVQAPAIYRLFGDKDGLLEAVAEHVMATYVTVKAALVEAEQSGGNDPVEDLRAAWFNQIEFGLANPAVFALLSDPARAQRSEAAQRGRRVLEGRVGRIAAAGRLRVGVSRAVDLVQAAGIGTIQSLLATTAERRDADLPAVMLQTVLDRILLDTVERDRDDDRDHRVALALAFRATVPEERRLSEVERGLLLEWLDRIVSGHDDRHPA